MDKLSLSVCVAMDKLSLSVCVAMDKLSIMACVTMDRLSMNWHESADKTVCVNPRERKMGATMDRLSVSRRVFRRREENVDFSAGSVAKDGNAAKGLQRSCRGGQPVGVAIGVEALEEGGTDGQSVPYCGFLV